MKRLEKLKSLLSEGIKDLGNIDENPCYDDNGNYYQIGRLEALREIIEFLKDENYYEATSLENYESW